MAQFLAASTYNGRTVPQRPADLPDFENPPIREVAIAGHFEPLIGLRQAHIGFFWSKVRDQFPEVEDREPLAPHLENLENKASSPLFQLEMTSSPMPNRAWFAASDHSELLQLQRDRFVHNWRYQKDGYPHFELLLERFTEGFNMLSMTLEELNLPQPRLVHAEVTYVNLIEAKALDDFLTFVASPNLSTGGVSSQGASGQLALRFPVDSGRRVIGSLYVECSPTRLSDSEVEGFQMMLTFRAPLPESNVSALRELLLLGRSAIVHSFTGLTETKYHKKWRRIQ